MAKKKTKKKVTRRVPKPKVHEDDPIEEEEIEEEVEVEEDVEEEETKEIVTPIPLPDEPTPVAGEVIDEGETVLGVEEKPKGRLAYKVTSGPARGYWKIGRHFTKTPTVIPIDELSEAEIEELERAQAVHTVVELIELED